MSTILAHASLARHVIFYALTLIVTVVACWVTVQVDRRRRGFRP